RTFRAELLLSSRSEAILLQFALQVLTSGLPSGGNPAFALQTVERRIERSVLDLQQVFCGALDMLRDLVGVGGPEEQGAQDQHVQRALQELDTVGGIRWHSSVDILPGTGHSG